MIDMPGHICKSGFSIVYLGFLWCLIRSDLTSSRLKSWLETGSPPLFDMGGLSLQSCPHFTCGCFSLYPQFYSRPTTPDSASVSSDLQISSPPPPLFLERLKKESQCLILKHVRCFSLPFRKSSRTEGCKD